MSTKDSPTTPIFHHLLRNQSSPLHRLIQQSRSLENLQTKILPCIPQELRGHVSIVGVREQTLLLITDAGIWAAKLRQQQQEILGGLERCARELGIHSINVKVRPKHEVPKTPRYARRLSKENAQLLREEAEHTTDEGLARVLRSIASHTRDDD
jgi:hypothetical protein